MISKKLISSILVLCAIITLMACTSTNKTQAEVPALPSPLPAATSVPVTPAPEATRKESSSKNVISVVPSTPVATVPSSQEPPLSEQIAQAATLDEAEALIAKLSIKANDPDGKLTLQFITRAKDVALKLINASYSIDDLKSYIQILTNAQALYGYDTSEYTDLANERIFGIEAYNKDSLYTYMKKYPKGHYTKELASLIKAKGL